mmetsp:Transcript_11437/g.17102  ORF Transcript_11437/g.17102 Transcript_11437/m.17102 type:complete len:625 (-) Transcript_11437:268-2142(-)
MRIMRLVLFVVFVCAVLSVPVVDKVSSSRPIKQRKRRASYLTRDMKTSSRLQQRGPPSAEESKFNLRWLWNSKGVVPSPTPIDSFFETFISDSMKVGISSLEMPGTDVASKSKELSSKINSMLDPIKSLDSVEPEKLVSAFRKALDKIAIDQILSTSKETITETISDSMKPLMTIRVEKPAETSTSVMRGTAEKLAPESLEMENPQKNAIPMSLREVKPPSFGTTKIVKRQENTRVFHTREQEKALELASLAKPSERIRKSETINQNVVAADKLAVKNEPSKVEATRVVRQAISSGNTVTNGNKKAELEQETRTLEEVKVSRQFQEKFEQTHSVDPSAYFASQQFQEHFQQTYSEDLSAYVASQQFQMAYSKDPSTISENMQVTREYTPRKTSDMLSVSYEYSKTLRQPTSVLRPETRSLSDTLRESEKVMSKEKKRVALDTSADKKKPSPENNERKESMKEIITFRSNDASLFGFPTGRTAAINGGKEFGILGISRRTAANLANFIWIPLTLTLWLKTGAIGDPSQAFFAALLVGQLGMRALELVSKSYHQVHRFTSPAIFALLWEVKDSLGLFLGDIGGYKAAVLLYYHFLFLFSFMDSIRQWLFVCRIFQPSTWQRRTATA